MNHWVPCRVLQLVPGASGGDCMVTSTSLNVCLLVLPISTYTGPLMVVWVGKVHKGAGLDQYTKYTQIYYKYTYNCLTQP